MWKTLSLLYSFLVFGGVVAFFLVFINPYQINDIRLFIFFLFSLLAVFVCVFTVFFTLIYRVILGFRHRQILNPCFFHAFFFSVFLISVIVTQLFGLLDVYVLLLELGFFFLLDTFLFFYFHSYSSK